MHSISVVKKFKCQKCDYEATLQGNLQKHIESKHEGKIFQCHECDFKATSKRELKIYTQFKHECKTFQCNVSYVCIRQDK